MGGLVAMIITEPNDFVAEVHDRTASIVRPSRGSSIHLRGYAGWHPDLLRLYSYSARWYKWALYDRDPVERWSKGRVTLLGDSAHAMLPYLGQGAAMALDRPLIRLELLSGTHDNPAAETAAICESFGYEAFIVQRGEKIAALPAITALGKNTSWGTDIESRNVLFLPR